MLWYQWMALAAVGFCGISCLFQVFRLIRLGKPVDHSRAAGNTKKAIAYAFTGAMSPTKKESAYLHLPTYTAGLLYHLGTFLSILLFIFIISGFVLSGWISYAISVFLIITVCCGTAILIKRVIKKELRSLSNPDDFISNLLVTLFQLFTLLVISTPFLLSSHSPTVLQSYYLIFTLLMLYLPVGKLRHTVYFFAARYHLGYFFGKRGVWPPGQLKAGDR